MDPGSVGLVDACLTPAKLEVAGDLVAKILSGHARLARDSRGRRWARCSPRVECGPVDGPGTSTDELMSASICAVGLSASCGRGVECDFPEPRTRHDRPCGAVTPSAWRGCSWPRAAVLTVVLAAPDLRGAPCSRPWRCGSVYSRSRSTIPPRRLRASAHAAGPASRAPTRRPAPAAASPEPAWGCSSFVQEDPNLALASGARAAAPPPPPSPPPPPPPPPPHGRGGLAIASRLVGRRTGERRPGSLGVLFGDRVPPCIRVGGASGRAAMLRFGLHASGGGGFPWGLGAAAWWSRDPARR